MGVRIGGLLCLGFLFASVVSYALLVGLTERSAEVGYRAVRRLFVGTAATALLAWVVMLAVWPWAWHAPLQRPLLALHSFTNYHHDAWELFNGTRIQSTAVPWDYLPRHFCYALPEVVLGAGILGLAGGGWYALRFLLVPSQQRRGVAYGLLGVAILFPPIWAILKSSTIYSGIRLFLFLVPPLCVVAAGALCWLSTRLRRWRLGWLPLLLVLAGSAQPLLYMQRSHPYWSTYCNLISGGFSRMWKKYSLVGYAPYPAAFLALRDAAWRRDPSRYLNSPLTVDGCFNQDIANDYLPPGFRHRRSGASFWVGTTLRDCHLEHADAPIIGGIHLRYVALALVRDLRAPPLPASGTWLGTYYLNQSFSGYPLLRNDFDVAFDWGHANPMPGIPADRFSVHWESCLAMDTPATVRFGLTADDGARLLLDSEPLLGTWMDPMTAATGVDVDLDAGLHHVEVYYEEGTANASVQLTASFNDGPLGPIPAHMLRPPPCEED